MTLAVEGCDVVLVARTARDLDVVAREIRDRTAVAVRTVAADLSAAEAVERLANAIGGLDVLVNNAGAIPPGDLTLLDEATWRRAWVLKVFGSIAMCRAFHAKLKARGGVIVNVIGSAGNVRSRTISPGAAATRPSSASRAVSARARRATGCASSASIPARRDRPDRDATQGAREARIGRRVAVAGGVRRHGIRPRRDARGDRRYRRVPGIAAVVVHDRRRAHDRRSDAHLALSRRVRPVNRAGASRVARACARRRWLARRGGY